MISKCNYLLSKGYFHKNIFASVEVTVRIQEILFWKIKFIKKAYYEIYEYQSL